MRRPGFTEELGEYRWIFEPVSEGRVNVRVLEFKEMWLAAQTRMEQSFFTRNVGYDSCGCAPSELQGLERTYGLAGYRQKWVEHDFPAAVGRVGGAIKLINKLGIP
jgi:hypothetical protein